MVHNASKFAANDIAAFFFVRSFVYVFKFKLELLNGKYMMFKKIALSALLVLSPAALAGDYQTEIGVGFLNADSGSATAITGRYHFNQVDTSSTVLAESSFYERENNVFAALSGGDIDSQQIGAEFYIDDRFYVAPSYTNIELFGEDEGFFAVDLGYSPFQGLRFSTTVPESDYEANINAKYLMPLSGGRALNLEARLIDDASSVSGDYYFNKTTAVGLGIGEDTLTLSGDKFFTNKVRAGISYTDTDFDNVVGVDVAVRF